jgi:hypothetical protein
LLAEGTREANIYFTADDITKPWNGLRIYDNNETGDSTKLVYCTIEHAYAKSDEEYGNNGGGLAIIRSDHVVVKHCTIRNNKTFGDKSSGGAGIAVGECSPLITQNLIYQNTAMHEGHGGGILLYRSESEVSNNIIYNNWAWGGGGLSVIDFLDWSDETPAIINNTIVDNYGDDHGGGFCFALGQANIINNIIYFNETGGMGPQINIGYNPHSQFHYNDIQGGKEAISHPGIGTIGHYENNIDEDPMFRWYPYDLWLNGDFEDNHSPCIDGGTNSIQINGTWIYAPGYRFRRPG